MSLLLLFSRLIDRLNETVGKAVTWLVLIAVVISSGNATIRYTFSMSSNAWLEAQWYLFAGVFLLGAGYTHLRNEHIRIDILSHRLSPRGHAMLDIFGTLFFLLPMAGLILVLSWPVFMNSFHSMEMSSNAGGLIRWPARLLVPAGFGLLTLQAISEIIKRVAFLTGHLAELPGGHGGHPPSVDEAEDLTAAQKP